METCINISHPEFRVLKASGLPEFTLKAYSRKYLDEFGRFPRLDEIPFSNSKPYLEKELNIKNNSTSINKILEFTGASSIEEALIKLNNIYCDQDIDIIPLNDDVIININPKSIVLFRELNYDDTVDYNHELLDNHVNSSIFLNRQIGLLAKKLGFNIKEITIQEMQQDEDLKNSGKNLWGVKAFVHNGTIYVNSDNASIDAPLHELMHIFIGTLQFSNPKLYQQLLDSVTQIGNYEDYLQKYSDRTRNDANEEILVDIFAKYITGLNDGNDLFSNPEIFSHIDRTIDRILDPIFSSQTISNDRKFSMSLKDLGLKLQSRAFEKYYSDEYQKQVLSQSQRHQKLNNYKQDLIRNGKLEENCS